MIFPLGVGDPVFRHGGGVGVELARDMLADPMLEKDLGQGRIGRLAANDAGGWAALVERLRNFSIPAIGLEARAATNVVLHVRCSQQGCRCARSIRSSCDSS